MLRRFNSLIPSRFILNNQKTSTISSSSNLPSLKQFVRFSSSSSSSSSTSAAIHSIRQVILNSNRQWVPLRNLAPEIDENVMESVSEEFGGLKQFIERSPEAKDKFEIRSNPTSFVLEISAVGSALSGHGNEMNASSSVPSQVVDPHHHPQQQAHQDAMPFAPPPPPPFANSEIDTNIADNINSTSNASEITGEGPKKKKKKKKKNKSSSASASAPAFAHASPAGQSLELLYQERKVLAAIPSFVTPLCEVVKYELNKYEVTAKEVADYIVSLKSKDCLQYVDLSYIGGDNTMQSAFNAIVGASNIELLKDRAFISLLAPFVETHRNEETDDVFRNEFQVADYDMCRLARHLSNDNFVSVSSLLRSSVPSLLQKPLLHVIAAYPLQFEYLPPGSKLPGNTFVSGVQEHCLAANEKGCPVVSVAMLDDDLKAVAQDGGEDDQDKKVEQPPLREEQEEDLGCVRFILASHELEKCLGGVPEKVKMMPFENLTQILQLMSGGQSNRKTKEQTPEFLLEKGMEFGYGKALPAGVKRVQLKHQCIRALIRLRFPNGNPFFNRDVFAQYLFDVLPPDELVSLEEIRRHVLPESGRTAAPMSSAYLVSYPHLFRVFQDERLNLSVQRADSECIPTNCIRQTELTDEDLLHAVFKAKPKNYDNSQMTSISTIAMKLPLAVSNEIKKRYKAFVHFFAKYPRQFTFPEGMIEGGGEHFTWGEPPAGVEENEKLKKGMYLIDA